MTNMLNFSIKVATTLTQEKTMQTKLSQVKIAFESGDYQKALKIAAKFSDLGKHRKQITLAAECFTNPRFYCQLVDIEQAKIDGIKALTIRYGFQ